MSKEIRELVREIQENKTEKVTQKITMAKKSKNEDNEQCSFYISKELKKKLKLRAIEEDKTITEMIVSSIEGFLDN